MKISRKRFLILLFISITGAFFSTWLINFDWVVRGIIKRDLGQLNLENNVIDQFMIDAVKANKWRIFTMEKKILILAHYFFDNKLIHLPYHHKYLHYKNIICGEFLFSTTYFFTWKEKTEKPVSYVGLFNPYQRYCFNPFANPV